MSSNFKIYRRKIFMMGTTGAIANNMAERIESANNGNGVTITYDKFGSTKITAR